MGEPQITRVYLFKAITQEEENRRWVYGSLLIDEDGNCKIAEKKGRTSFTEIPVIKQTICQFIKKGKDNVQLWEGDIDEKGRRLRYVDEGYYMEEDLMTWYEIPGDFTPIRSVHDVWIKSKEKEAV